MIHLLLLTYQMLVVVPTLDVIDLNVAWVECFPSLVHPLIRFVVIFLRHIDHAHSGFLRLRLSKLVLFESGHNLVLVPQAKVHLVVGLPQLSWLHDLSIRAHLGGVDANS